MTSPVLNIFGKEVRNFFTTPTGYIVLAVFFVGAALFLWVFPGEYNVLDNGYANLDGLFVLAPWLFLFLCPAVTMRTIAEERQQGTLELLLTRPLSAWQLVGGKFLASWCVIALALVPALLWFGAVYIMAEPIGNVDAGTFWGSYSGLVLLAAVYSAIGVFGSSVAGNQISAFVVSALICFGLLYGFDLIGSLFDSGSLMLYLKNLGIDAHYRSMSRGVLDSRDVLYMILLTGVFLTAAKMVVIQKR